MARSRRTPGVLFYPCCSELFNHRSPLLADPPRSFPEVENCKADGMKVEFTHGVNFVGPKLRSQARGGCVSGQLGPTETYLPNSHLL